MAEALLNHYGEGKFKGLSAGSLPAGKIHTQSIAALKDRSIATKNLRSKSWDEFKNDAIDIVITVCDAAAGESCPLFPGSPLKAHWPAPDPAKLEGSKKEIAEEFSRICDVFERRVQMLIHLPLEQMDEDEARQKLSLIGSI